MVFKKFLYLSSAIIVLASTTSLTTVKKTKPVSYPKYLEYNIPYLQKNFVAFKQALAVKESQGKYTVVNSLGYLGKYQFGRTTLERLDIYNTKEFLRNPELQEKAFIALCKVNKWILRNDIEQSVGKTINGIVITESGILAAAHLSGAGNVKNFLRSNGTNCFSDAYGTTIKSYLKKFAGYDLSIIEADQNAKA
ncbi:peptidoglycan-binding protein LysM [Polaribacter glomeratus]|uniref:Peptidoglycan-binding protein LysM n=1 Tax=Polaribacter glomeratus TaxID=102 RepID=A0A2S7WXQ8_9FLAO|nr:peptidoglycan-binding protein LysM [Polaribacter glomeratus]TXD64563.1 peptidoglycan-binding protein LysM [Polaribacter glomeratus]